MGLHVILLGAPGSGKGTQAARIADRFELVHVSSGDLFRVHMRDGTELGRRVRDIVARGDLVPDDIVLEMLHQPVVEAAAAGGYVLDGFPRTLEQARAAYEIAKELGVVVDVVVALDVPDDELVRRLLARGHEEGRPDDTEETIRHRLRLFDECTRPLLEYYRERGVLARVDGNRPVDEVTASVFAAVEAAAAAKGD